MNKEHGNNDVNKQKLIFPEELMDQLYNAPLFQKAYPSKMDKGDND